MFLSVSFIFIIIYLFIYLFIYFLRGRVESKIRIINVLVGGSIWRSNEIWHLKFMRKIFNLNGIIYL